MKKKILVVDDEEKITELIQWILEEENFQVITAKSGKEALDKMRNYAPDLIILDIMMPEMDGWQVCREIRKDPVYKRLPIIIVTIKTSNEDQIKGLNIGADAYLPKPFNPHELIERTKLLLNIPRK